MKVLTTNFLTCPITPCRSSPLSFPLHFRDAELVRTPTPYNALFLRNLLPRLEWAALLSTAAEVSTPSLPPSLPFPSLQLANTTTKLGFTTLPPTPPQISTTGPADDGDGEGKDEDAVAEEEEKVLRELHTLLLETRVEEGKLVCGNCGHEFRIHQGIANFLLPGHLGEFLYFLHG